MSRTSLVGLATPRIVHGCTVRNGSIGDVYVRVLYEPMRDQQDSLHERRLEFQLPRGCQTKIPEERFNMGTYDIREAIRIIEVTRSDGQIQRIQAPFENVYGIELDWFFLIEDRNIKSVKSNRR